MEITTIQVTTNAQGEITCGELGIKTHEWYNLLQQSEARQYLDTLFAMLRSPQHKSSCKALGETYGNVPQHYEAKITAFSQWVQKELNRFKVIQPDGTEYLWGIPMSKGRVEKKEFVWYLRSELIEALQKKLLEDLIEKFRKEHTIHAFCGYEETYKWELINKTQNASTLDIIHSLRGKNVIDNPRVEQIWPHHLKHHPKEFQTYIDRLFNESDNLLDRLQQFKTEMRSIAEPSWKNFANDERTAAALLTCKYPEKYTFFIPTFYTDIICPFFGIEHKTTGKKYDHYMQIIDAVNQAYGQQIQAIMANEISTFKIKPEILATQTLFWCMQEEMKQASKLQERKIWLTGYTIDGQSLYDQFLKEGIWQAYFKDAKSNFQEQVKLAESIHKGDIIVLKSAITKGTQHDQSYLRIKAVGRVCCNTIQENKDGAPFFSCQVQYINNQQKDFQGPYYGSYAKTVNQLKSKHQEILNYIDSILEAENMKDSKYEPYIELLKANKNLVLTGAPGTGKTYMAKAIAAAMDAETTFVQFHPSYDYTDFVEGLRPISNGATGQIGFERKDGVFKAFCKEALKNFSDSQKSMAMLEKEQTWEEKLQQLINDAIENDTVYQLTNKGRFTITEFNGTSITVHNLDNEKTVNIIISSNDILELLNNEVTLDYVHNIRQHFNRQFNTQADSYVFILTKEIRRMKALKILSNVKKVERKNYVFIIDEINRGEVSKIFGELFYAIDPGYRGQDKVKIQTQYQNLVPDTDIFANGFYVPENVYILATMNDIDRSVESMDFAMRRRFTWQEVIPEDTQDMLDETLGSDLAEEAKYKMAQLNEAISRTDGLGEAYQIGPAYFLKLKDHHGDFSKLWKMNLAPLLHEYLRGTRKSQENLQKFKDIYFGNPTDQIDFNEAVYED